MNAGPSLSLAEWTVLALISEVPAHGFAICRLTAPDGELGRIWHIPRPVIYRSIGRLEEDGLVAPQTVEPGRGPQRTIYAATPAGHEAAAAWLETPVEHIRDIRSHLLIKLALLDRAGTDATGLLQQQKAILEPIASAIAKEQPQQQGFDATLLAWRRATAAAARRFLDDITPSSACRACPHTPMARFGNASALFVLTDPCSESPANVSNAVAGLGQRAPSVQRRPAVPKRVWCQLQVSRPGHR